MQLTETPTKLTTKKSVFALLFVFLFVILLIYVSKRTPDKRDPNFISHKGYITNDFPVLPTYPNAKVIESRKLTGATDKKGYNAAWTVKTKESAPQIADWYKLELEKLGWVFQEPDPQNVTNVEAIYLAKKEDVDLMLFVEKEDAETVKILIEIPLAS